MRALTLRLLTLLALVLMPFGMGAASAVPVHHAAAAADAGHCDEQGGEPAGQSREQASDCAVSCSMLALAEARIQAPVQTPRMALARPLLERGTGLHPDTATPPPKHS